MTWTPTEGQKRADTLMLELRALADACGIDTATVIFPMYHARVFDLISKTLDQALADSQWHDALGKVVGNGHDHDVAPEDMLRYERETRVELSPGPSGTVVARKIDPAYPFADPAVEAHEEGPPGSSALFSIDPLKLGDVQLVPMGVPDEAPKKKRGRPKGSKAKKAKPAKAKAAAAKVAVENGAAEPMPAPDFVAQAPEPVGDLPA